jgi:hypothetical protein
MAQGLSLSRTIKYVMLLRMLSRWLESEQSETIKSPNVAPQGHSIRKISTKIASFLRGWKMRAQPTLCDIVGVVSAVQLQLLPVPLST